MAIDDKPVLVAINDIFFYAKLKEALSPAGYQLERVRSADEAVAKAGASRPAALVINMNEDRFSAIDLLKDVKALDGLAALPVLAFANHEEVDTFRQARELGVTKIVSRNEFSARTLALVEGVVEGGDQASADSFRNC